MEGMKRAAQQNEYHHLQELNTEYSKLTTALHPGQTREKQIPGQNLEQNSLERHTVLGYETQSKVMF